MSNTIFVELWQKSSTSILVTFIAMLLLLPLACRLQWLDFPTNRKDHSTPTPVIGGLAIWVGIITTTALYHTGTNTLSREFLTYILAGGILILMGQVDDKYDLPWWLRLCVQALVGTLTATWGGIQITQLGHLFSTTPVQLGILSIPFTVLAIVGLINAVNMIDGMDGFAGSLGLIALLMLCGAAFYSGNSSLAADISILCGAILAFLYFNLRLPWRIRAKAFMGNGGSAFLGFTIAWAAIRVTQTPEHPVPPVLAIWLTPIPLIDCLALMTHRIRRGFSPFKADRNHIHHLMQDAGIAPMRTTIVICAFSALAGLTASISLRANVNEGLLLAAFACLFYLWYWITAKRERALSLLRFLGRTTILFKRGSKASDTLPSPTVKTDR